MARTPRKERDEFCRRRTRAGLAHQKVARCCKAEDWRGAPRPMGPREVSTQWPLPGMGVQNGSPASKRSLRIANLETRKERGLQAIQEGPVFPRPGRG